MFQPFAQWHAHVVQPYGHSDLHMGREHGLQAQGICHGTAQGDADQHLMSRWIWRLGDSPNRDLVNGKVSRKIMVGP